MPDIAENLAEYDLWVWKKINWAEKIVWVAKFSLKTDKKKHWIHLPSSSCVFISNLA